MRSFRSAAWLLILILTHISVFGAQQSSTSKKKSPSLTTDDVVRSKPDSSTEESGQPKSAGAKADGDKVSPEEAAWRESVAAAREKAKEAQRVAEEAELKVTGLRNELSQSGHTPNERNSIAAELDQVGKQLIDLRAQARAANDALNALLEEGKEKGFAEAPGPKAESADGKPNEKYYRERYNKLTQDLRDAERKVMLFENRVRELNQRITNNSVTGDNFYIARVQEDRDEAQRRLEEAQTAREKAQSELEALKEEARRAGVPPGVFR